MFEPTYDHVTPLTEGPSAEGSALIANGWTWVETPNGGWFERAPIAHTGPCTPATCPLPTLA